MSGVQVLHGASDDPLLAVFLISSMELDLQPGDVVKVLESAALGWVRARVIRVKSGGRVVVQARRVGLSPRQDGDTRAICGVDVAASRLDRT